jgi:hypothetical protein
MGSVPMSRLGLRTNVHLVGSAEHVLETCTNALGPHVAALPDGEVGYRIHWIVFQALHVFTPQIELVNRSAPIDGKEQWLPRGSKDRWRFNGYVSIETAERDYGVAINPDTLALDKERTAALRAR